MNNHKIKEIKLKVENEINITKEKIIKYTELCKPIAPENSIGRVSRMDAINNKSIVEAALRELRIKIKELEYISNKIHENNYGVCLKCKTVIPFERLIIQPHNQFCVECAQ
jgi:DnaK suppressor protein